MRVGILTYHNSYNFGANLQVLATQKALEKQNVTPIVVNYRSSAKYEFYQTTTSLEQAAVHESFIEKYLTLSPLLNSTIEVEEYCLDALDAVIVGSDAVFRIQAKYDPRKFLRQLIHPDIAVSYSEGKNVLPPYWLDWKQYKCGAIPVKTSLAASAMGTKFYLLKLSLYRDLWKSIRSFDLLTVRDAWTQLMIRFISLGTIIPSYCPDPVFVLNNYFTVPSNEIPDIDVSRTILVSGKFSPEWLLNFKEICRSSGYLLGNLPNPDQDFIFPGADIEIALPLSPLEWYSLLARAAGYIGIRFHALVSCMINGTPFLTVDSLEKYQLTGRLRSKIHDLCKRAGVLERYVTQKRLCSRPSEYVLKDLFKARTMAQCEAYVEKAKDQFMDVIDKILKLAEMRSSGSKRFSVSKI
ncbi:MAG: polysaccharide pyruvyl transferase family protein [Clostridiales bacterium]|nr:polysaccharide pyruvyl transferase family protein [Clostridiales bacterium]